MTTTATRNANVAAIRRFWEGFNSHNPDLWDEACTPDFINHDPALPTPDVDLATLKQIMTQILHETFPDMQASEHELIVDGDTVVTHCTLRGTHLGAFLGIPSSGKECTIGGIWLAHLRQGKIQEQWVYFNMLGLLQQVGALPALGAADR
jgi:steroid delta-isomerase-like uncharacterized protein